ncbi:MAG: hypothetical protein F6K42_18045 [Leptolyngbya sp. SIO1D8]|nr:hypothetical protein [Leptolyngbya sp. SIO1D8]
MYTLELNLKQSPLPLMIQKQSLEDAETDYKRVTDALNTGNAVLLELTCDQVPNKRVTILVSEIAAIQMYEKSGTASASGKPPGFFSLVGEQSQS